MARDQLRRALLVIPLGLATFAGCKDTEVIAPKLASVSLAQGVGGVWTVNSLIDPGDGTCDDANCTLREAIAAADDGAQIGFTPALQGVIELSNGEFVVLRKVSIDGGGRITVNAHGSSRHFNFSIRPPEVDASVILDGLTLVNGFTPLRGGSISVEANRVVQIRNSVIRNNMGLSGGGGIWIDADASVNVVNSTIEDNSASGSGTGGGGVLSDGNLSILNSTLSGNSAPNTGNGGAVYVQSGTAQIKSSTISGNSATFGGGILNGNSGGTPTPPGGTVNITSSTITRNSSGIVQGGSGGAHPMIVLNTIVAGNFIQDCGSPSGGLTSLGYNITTCVNFFNAVGDRDIVAAQAFTEVLEQELKDNGGPTMTHALLARGLAVDAGYCPGESADQRGFARPVDDPTLTNVKDGCDNGAYEAQGPVVAIADLMVSQTVDKNSVKQGDKLTYTVRVQNLGPQTAPNVVLNNVLSSGVTFVEVRVNKGTTTAPPMGETGTVTWNLGDLVNQANEVAEIKVTVLVKGKTTITNTATVTGNVSDPNPANNSASITVSVVAGKTGSPRG